MDGNANDRPDGTGSGGSVGGSGGSAGGGSAGTTGGSGGSAGTTGGSGGSADAGPDASDGGGVDGAPPTCTDGVKNSDETGVDCGGHCGKCAPGKSCLVNADCQYACRADMTCADCNVAADCPGVESECEHRTCTAGACGTAREAAGTVLTVQATGDCKRRQCAANGSVASANDDTDVPDDRNPCTNDICTSGAASHSLMPAGSNCGGANSCNASGQCIGCTVAADCPGTDTACRTRTCSAAGVCGFNFTASGTTLVDPTAGDCKGLKCDGAGNSQVFNDSADLPVDNNVCTTDECSSGTPSHRPVASGAACGGSLVCDGASKCVECLSASTCPGTDAECHTRSCMAGQCGISNSAAGTLIAAQTPRDCKKSVCDGQGGTTTANDDLDLPFDGNACTQDVCTAGMPTNPFVTAGNSCGGSTVCDGQGACVVCITASTCPGTDTDCHHRTCIGGACGIANTLIGTPVSTQTTGDCKKVVCDGNGQPGTVTDDADLPADGNLCTLDVCASGVPSNPNQSSGTNCGTNLMCNGQGACVGCITAADCGTNTTCQTHTCTNGQCGVNNAAAGTLLPGQITGDCKKVQCDGMGQSQTVNDDGDRPVDTNACTQDLCNAGIPSHPPETAGTACSQGGGSKCNGSGTAACVQCLATTECPGTDTECHVRTCNAGVCGISNTADGTALTAPGTQTPRDCKKSVCMGGNPVVMNDNSDLPVDNNACTMDLCTNGAPSNPVLAANAPCNEGGGTRCNGSATAPACVQCIVAADCGPNPDCQLRTCSTAGLCGTSNLANGTLVGIQPPGDCKKNVCNGNGALVPATDSNDVPVDNNDCTFDVCNNDQPSNPPRAANAPCSTGICDGASACVQCLDAADCGTNTACKTFSCSAAHVCSSADEANGKPVTNVPAGNCHQDVCMGGLVTTVVDNNDVFVDGNPCTTDLCMSGVPQNANLPAATSCGPNLMCDGNGQCVGCLMDTDCPLPPNACQTRVCNSGTCGFTNVATDTPLPPQMQMPGDCHQDVCNGQGAVVSKIDNNDTPAASGQCVQSVCTAGVASNPPFAAGTTCSENSGTKCDGLGACVECLNASECPDGPDTECHTRTCTDGVCGVSEPVLGTPVSGQMSGDCKTNVCDGFGEFTTEANDSDLPADTDCALAMCNGGAKSFAPRPLGTICSENGGFRCDSAPACVETFMTVRVGDGNAALTNVGTAVFIEERFESDGVVFRTIPLPTAAGTPKPLVLSGVADSDGALALSGDGHFVTLAGYSAAVTTAGIAGTGAATVPRVAASINLAGVVDTSTTFGTTAFNNNNVRSAVSNTGAQFWAAGNGSSTNRGVYYATAGATTSLNIESASNSTRVCVIAFGGLYCDASNGSLGVFKVGSGLPTTATTSIPSLTGTTLDAGAVYYGIALLDVTPGGIAPDTMYVADERATASGGGIQKWTTADGVNWALAGTFNNGLSTVGVRGLAAHTSAAGVVLLASTAIVSPSTNPDSNAIIKYVDPGVTTPAQAAAVPQTILQATTPGSNRVYRGIAMSPR